MSNGRWKILKFFFLERILADMVSQSLILLVKQAKLPRHPIVLVIKEIKEQLLLLNHIAN